MLKTKINSPTTPRYSGVQAKRYVSFAKHSFSWKYLEKPSLEKVIKPLMNPSTTVLDAGCGGGRSTELLIALGYQRKNITGVDVSLEMLQIARRKHPEVRFVESDLLMAEFKDEAFDLIVSNMVLQYFDKKIFEKIMKKFCRWLKPNGSLVFITVHPFRFSEHIDNYFNEGSENEITPWGTTISYFPKTFTDYINSVINSGFRILKVQEPRPITNSKRINSGEFDKYSTAPTRLLIYAEKN